MIGTQLSLDWHRAGRGSTLAGGGSETDQRGIIMRTFIIVPCFAALLATPALAAGGPGIGKGHTMGFPADTPPATEVTQTGKITHIDSSSSSFSAHGTTFQTSASTTYDLNGQSG